MANKLQIKRTTVTTRTPNTTNSANAGYIDTGELAINLTDGKMFSSNGTAYFEVGANLQSLNVTGNAAIAAIIANGSIGSPGQSLTSNGTGLYWAAGAGSGTVTQVGTGDGLTGGPITTTGTISVVANNGIVANTTGVFANAGTGVVVNATGIHVNSSYIGTLAANSATYLGGNTALDLRNYTDAQSGNAYSNATSFAANADNISSGTLNAARLPATVVQNTDSRTLSGNLVISGTYFNPSTNTNLLGNSTQRWVLSANTGSFSGEVSGITTLAAGNTTITGFVNASSSIQGGSSLTISGALSGVTTAAMGNTTITGFANASVSVNSALLTVGTDFIANTTGAYHTGTVNAASFTTTGLVANVTALVPTSNTILLGNSIGRFVISANTGDFSGAVTGTSANMSTSVNSALLTVGTNFIANTTALVVTTPLTANGTTGSSGEVLLSNGVTGSPYWGTVSSSVPATYVQNTDSRTLSGNLVISGTYFNPSANTILLGNSIQRWVLSANTGDFSGAVTGTSANMSTSVNSALLTVGSNFIANTTALVVTTPLTANGTTGSSGEVLHSNGTTGAPYWTSVTASVPATYVQNTDSRTLSGNLVISGTYFNPSANTILLGNSTQRWVFSANTIDTSGAATIATTLSAGNTTITGFANASVSVNSALLTVGTSFIANTTGAYHTGTINAASHTTSGVTANATGVYPSSNSSGTALGDSTRRWIVNANTGNFSGQVDASSFNTTSDSNKKDNIETLVGSLDKIINMRGVSFTWKDNNKKSIGVIAQEIESIVPEIVHTNIEGFKSVSYDSIIGLLIEAIKEQQETINYLKLKIETNRRNKK